MNRRQHTFSLAGLATVAMLAVVIWSLSTVSAFAGGFGGVEEFYLAPTVQYFTWEEFSGSSRLLKESGPLFGIGAAVDVNLFRTESAGTLKLKGKIDLFGGEVDYDGQTTDVNPQFDGLPVKTDVVYFGTREEVDLGWRLPVREVAIEPFAGIGHRWWLRDVQGSTTVDRTGTPLVVGGLTESWQTVYGRLGARGRYDVKEGLRLFAEAGAKYPFYNENEVDFPGVGRVTVKPGKEWAAFAEIGLRYGRFRPSIYYEGFRFARSPAVPVAPGVAIFQPRSESDIIGLNFSWSFR